MVSTANQCRTKRVCNKTETYLRDRRVEGVGGGRGLGVGGGAKGNPPPLFFSSLSSSSFLLYYLFAFSFVIVFIDWLME